MPSQLIFRQTEFRGAPTARAPRRLTAGAQQGRGVIHREIAGRAGDGGGRIETCRYPSYREDDDQIGAEGSELTDDSDGRRRLWAVRTTTAGDADGHGQHREAGPRECRGRRRRAKRRMSAVRMRQTSGRLSGLRRPSSITSCRLARA